MVHSDSSMVYVTDEMADFIQSGSLNEWFCNTCTPLRKGHVDCMTLQAAQHHERHSAEHAQNVIEAEHRLWRSSPDPEDWLVPSKDEPPLTKEEVRLRESRTHVDLVQDMVPFWIRGVQAAEKGEVLRLEEFLNTLQEASDSWAQGNPWGYGSAQDWGNGWVQDDNAGEGWGVNDDKRRRPGQNRKCKYMGSKARRSGQQQQIQHDQSRSKAYDFVEDVARQEAADEERRRRMHHFFKMPTDEKVRKIDEVIRDLLAT
ncbi:hypothetical protein D9615_001401 [Tricholomella constricta]|uniref:Uncharacterized protein n=1 Tax=Tricholomella constricta TaxID=117010 RepID=A0A8H5HKB8_9AGAR|nr:hypothetical protein D9615_001401 [Tricholomella constricta]